MQKPCSIWRSRFLHFADEYYKAKLERYSKRAVARKENHVDLEVTNVCKVLVPEVDIRNLRWFSRS
jgi:hypothetical protein